MWVLLPLNVVLGISISCFLMHQQHVPVCVLVLLHVKQHRKVVWWVGVGVVGGCFFMRICLVSHGQFQQYLNCPCETKLNPLFATLLFPHSHIFFPNRGAVKGWQPAHQERSPKKQVTNMSMRNGLRAYQMSKHKAVPCHHYKQQQWPVLANAKCQRTPHHHKQATLKTMWGVCLLLWFAAVFCPIPLNEISCHLRWLPNLD